MTCGWSHARPVRRRRRPRRVREPRQGRLPEEEHRLGSADLPHITQASADSPDKNWITCDNWPNSKGYGTCYEEYDNNGNGNRILMQWTDDSGLTWHPAPNLNTNPAAPGNGNTGDVSGETTLGAAPASPGDTNIKVVSVDEPRHHARRGVERRRHQHQGREHGAVLRLDVARRAGQRRRHQHQGRQRRQPAARGVDH